MLSAFLVPIKIGPGFWSRVPGVGPGFYSFPFSLTRSKRPVIGKTTSQPEQVWLSQVKFVADFGDLRILDQNLPASSLPLGRHTSFENKLFLKMNFCA